MTKCIECAELLEQLKNSHDRIMQDSEISKLTKWREAVIYSNTVRIINAIPAADVVEMPEGKPGDYLEWDCGMGYTRIYYIHSINIYPGGEMRYDLNKFAPIVNHPNIRRIMNRDEAEKELKRRGLL